jgi:hypothetical protein
MERQSGKGFLPALMLVAAVAAALLGPAKVEARTPLGLQRALQSAVLVEGDLRLQSQDGAILGSAAWSGSGWTASCRPRGMESYEIEVCTAGHVLDYREVLGHLLAREGLEDSPSLVVVVRFRVLYRDGTSYDMGLEAVLPGEGDGASLAFPSAEPRVVLPVGDPSRVEMGDSLWVVGCPGGLQFVVAQGVLSAPMDRAGIPGAPAWWLSTVPAAPGSSGAPVLNEYGEVVGHVVAIIVWPIGDGLTVVQPLSSAPAGGAAGGAQ